MLDDDLLDGMRDDVTAALPDACEVTRQGARGEFDNTTGLYDEAVPVDVWSGACRVRTQLSAERQVLFGDAHQVLGRYVATVPFDASGIAVDDFLTVTESDDPDIVGQSFRVLEVRLGSWSLGRRLTLELRTPWTPPPIGS